MTVMDFDKTQLRGELLFNEPMCLHTSLRTGGPADIYAVPEDREDLAVLLARLHERHLPWLTIGRGYNLLVGDRGIRGAVISLERFNRVSLADATTVTAEAGVDNLALVRFAQRAGLGGIGFIAGIPGTVGGALKMNAGAYGEGILSKISTLSLLRGGGVANLAASEVDYGYRYLKLAAEDIILAASFALEPRDPEATEEEIQKDLELRRTKHNVGFPSAGSFFKNPRDMAAWKLIDAAGMRGARHGGAMVSPVHSNFLVNSGGATTADFLELATKVKNAVHAISGVTLEEEVRIVGEI